MKQNIGIGNVVDDGTGDYLRKGGEKINSNFSEIYDNLGDGDTPFPAGAWKKHDQATQGSILDIKFGQSFVIDTTGGDVDVNLPKGSFDDFGKVVKLRDVFGTWGVNAIKLVPATKDTIKGVSGNTEIQRKFSDLELVYASPGSWEYLDNKLINKLSATDSSTVQKIEIIATKGQTDFPTIMGGAQKYNANQFELYRKGNLLYYGGEYTTGKSDYGSIGTKADEIVDLDGTTIRLASPCDEGDVITAITFLDDIAVYRSSYTSATITVYQKSEHESKETINGVQIVTDLTKKNKWTFDDFGFTITDGTFNPYTTELLVNGRQLTMAGRGDLPTFACEQIIEGDTDAYGNPLIPDATTQQECMNAGGNWTYSGIDFSVCENSETDPSNRTILIREKLEDGDVVTVRWFNNNIGTTMQLEEILEQTDDRYITSVEPITLSNRIRYNSYNDPTPRDVEPDGTSRNNDRIESLSHLMDLVYPVGSLYFNAHNKANPRDFIGFGTWIAYGEGKAIVGWEDGTDENFSYYRDESGSLVSPGGTGGTLTHDLKKNEIPTLQTEEEVLIKDDNGTIIIGQCLADPEGDSEGPGYHKYREDIAIVNEVNNPVPISMLQPYITLAIWLRVA